MTQINLVNLLICFAASSNGKFFNKYLNCLTQVAFSTVQIEIMYPDA